MGESLEAREELEEEIQDEIIDDEIVDDPENPDDKPKDEIEEWMKDDDEADQTESETISLHSHIRTKRKLKGRISEKDDEIEKLKAENESLKANQNKLPELPKRPRRDDFESDDDYENAMDEYEDKKEAAKYEQFQKTQNIQANQDKIRKRIEDAVDGHYERAEKLLESSGISEDAFKKADQSVREAIEAIRPKQGDIIADQFISRLGKGSEKVLFKLGRSKALLGEFIHLLANDQTGLDAAVFLGQQKELLLNMTKRRSTAPPPDTEINGDESGGQKEGVLKKKYNEAHKKGKGQVAWDIKKKAKAAGFDTSKW